MDILVTLLIVSIGSLVAIVILYLEIQSLKEQLRTHTTDIETVLDYIINVSD